MLNIVELALVAKNSGIVAYSSSKQDRFKKHEKCVFDYWLAE